MVFRAQGRYTEAMARLEESLEVVRSVLGDAHLEVAETLDAIGGALIEQGRLAEALVNCDESLRIRRAALGRDHVDCDAPLFDRALVKERLGDAPGAQADLRECLEICVRALGDAHERTVKRREVLARLEAVGGS